MDCARLLIRFAAEMLSARYGMARFEVLLLLAASFLLCQAQQLPAPAACPANCTDALAYIGPRTSPRILKLGQVAINFNADIVALAAANNLDVSDESTLADITIQADQGLRVPLHECSCKGGNYSSDGITYTVQAGDSLSEIAATGYGGLLPFESIATANNIPDPSSIKPGQVFIIPIPCSCVAPGASPPALPLSYVLVTGDNYTSIGEKFNTRAQSMASFNPSVNASALIASTTIQVPLPACSYNLSAQSLDNGLLVAYDAFTITAGKCVQCSCSDNLTTSCIPAPADPTCTFRLVCAGTNITIGSSSFVQRSGNCEVSTCIYEGYNQTSIITRLETRSVAGTSCGGIEPPPTPPPPPRVLSPIAVPAPGPPSLPPPLTAGGSTSPPPSPGAAPPRRLLEATWLAVVTPVMLLLLV